MLFGFTGTWLFWKGGFVRERSREYKTKKAFVLRAY